MNSEPAVAIVYSSVDGQTKKITDRIAELLRNDGVRCEVSDFGDAERVHPSDFAAVLLGAPVRYGKHDRRLPRYVNRHAEALNAGRFGLFSVDLISRNPEKTRLENNVYVRKLLQRLDVQPDELGIFAGRLDYPNYGWLDRRLIQLTMKFMDGPTDPSTVIEYTDWERVEQFARRMRKLVAANEQPAQESPPDRSP